MFLEYVVAIVDCRDYKDVLCAALFFWRTKGVAPNVACYNRIFKIHAGNRQGGVKGGQTTGRRLHL